MMDIDLISRHVARAHEPTRTLGWCLRGMNSDKLGSDEPTGIVGVG